MNSSFYYSNLFNVFMRVLYISKDEGGKYFVACHKKN